MGACISIEEDNKVDKSPCFKDHVVLSGDRSVLEECDKCCGINKNYKNYKNKKMMI